jgi:hypothetical protein
VKKESEFNKFDATMRKLMSVSHEELKAKLDAEKREKAARKKSKALKRRKGDRAKP